MIKEGINGFCMALADSVPGVSGGTVAFIMGFYDRFIRSIHNLVFGKKKSKGYEAILEKVTKIAAACFILISLALVAIE